MKCFNFIKVLFLTVPMMVFADVPNLINYQERLRQYGQPVSGTKNINFKIHDASTNGTPDLRDRLVYGCSDAEDPGPAGRPTLPTHTYSPVLIPKSEPRLAAWWSDVYTNENGRLVRKEEEHSDTYETKSGKGRAGWIARGATTYWLVIMLVLWSAAGHVY